MALVGFVYVMRTYIYSGGFLWLVSLMGSKNYLIRILWQAVKVIVVYRDKKVVKIALRFISMEPGIVGNFVFYGLYQTRGPLHKGLVYLYIYKLNDLVNFCETMPTNIWENPISEPTRSVSAGTVLVKLASDHSNFNKYICIHFLEWQAVQIFYSYYSTRVARVIIY